MNKTFPFPDEPDEADEALDQLTDFILDLMDPTKVRGATKMELKSRLRGLLAVDHRVWRIR